MFVFHCASRIINTLVSTVVVIRPDTDWKGSSNLLEVRNVFI